jgi:very-short-patch-repair endonuclease
MACSPEAVLSHRSAAWLWQLAHRPDGEIDVMVVGRNGGRRPHVRVHETRCLGALERTKREGIPVTTPARTLLDLAESVSPRELERALDEARVRRLGRRSQLTGVLDASPGRKGAAALAALLDREGDPKLTRSEAEERTLALVRAARLPRPRVNARVGGLEVDLLWREQRLVVEVDGYAYHSSRTAFERDRLRDAELGAAGFRVMRLTWRVLVDEPEAVVARLASALAQPSGTPD